MTVKVLVVLLGIIAVCKSEETNNKQTRSMSMFASKCPPGLWCGKKRSLVMSNLKKINKLDEDASKPLDERFASKCPPGLWCGKKRNVPSKLQEIPEIPVKGEIMHKEKPHDVMEDRNVHRRFMSRCPPGLWCGKKRDLVARFAYKCPPGLWCGK